MIFASPRLDGQTGTQMLFALCDAVSAENDGSEASCNDRKKKCGCCDVFHGAALALLMGPKHPAGDEIAEHSGGDERNRTQENGNTVTMFHPPPHSFPIRKKPRALGAWASPSHKP
jgi:hypothetical protein